MGGDSPLVSHKSCREAIRVGRGRQLAWDLCHEPIEQRHVDALVAELRTVYLRDDRPWVIGFSGGKDSTCVVQLVYRMLMDLAGDQKTKPVHIVSSDTLVENPAVVAWIERCHAELRDVATRFNLPVHLAVVKPEPDDTFWVCLLGKGYPAPTADFRWCTSRLKIEPAERYVLENVDPDGHILQLLGSRTAESRNRAATIEAHALEGKFGTTGSLSAGLAYMPIQHWDNDNVWEYLRGYPKPWEPGIYDRLPMEKRHYNQELFELYQGAHAGECVLDFDKRTASCGGSRFGCWTCTVVEQDKSMSNMVATVTPEFAPLLAFRQKILDYRRDRSKRSQIGRNGKLRHNKHTGEVAPGPYLLEVRAELLGDLFGIERQLGMHLISDEELHWIRHWWQHDGGDSGMVEHLRQEAAQA